MMRHAKQIGDVTTALLARHGISGPAVPVDRIAREHGARIVLQPYADDISGFVFPDKKGPVIGVNVTHHPHRRRFTIAHELGHLLLHSNSYPSDEVHVDRTLRATDPSKKRRRHRNDVSSQGTDPEEMEANRFAAALLMPASFIAHDLKDVDPVEIEDDDFFKRLATRYGVSLQALLFRLQNLGYLHQV